MTIQEKTPLERAALQFKSAGLGDQSAWDAARLLCESGMSFETAAVLGQRLDEVSEATTARIREAAGRYRSVQEGPRTRTAWGRPLQETATPDGASEAAEARRPRRSKAYHHPETTKVIDGVLHHEVVEYEEVVRESQEPRRSAWGRKIEG